ncbi:flagellar basal-body MS-ring/collar protein FliF [Aestuariirhabdus litorea]|uniref:Flagellar M-ring protein n=1 Tax=Aestuariirhabdus litorea TaxID=2528527 RepID=A0A3P3VRB9_9GAMM|nr:flagellar basal-body MS-ring/collar protein FliF [Aestuariirhabdus litorea]RRJ84994.1 flagellar basal body M-ring protein FliF [Aestuariirhabdus litorea]RWW98219.1 flagellar basal body M-ring protein FliF [Endozoicomonadaceae bacterium GTF-13]
MATAATETGQDVMAKGGAGSSDLFSSLGDLSVIRQVGLMIGLAASVAVGFAVVLWTQQPDYQPLYGNLQDFDSAQVVQSLQESNIHYRIEPNTGAILVAAEEIAKARMTLAAAGITGDRTIGMELLDKEQGLGTSQFMENVRYRRGLEGELARTIASLYNIRNARVHLAIPKRSVFVRDPRKPSASVFVELYGTRGLAPQQVTAIMNLVASSVPEMSSEEVTVVDQNGTLLSVVDNEKEAQLKQANRQLEYTKKLEDTLARRVHNILTPVLGTGNYQTEVSASVDFTAVEQTSEQYNPDAPALRSEQVLDELRTGSKAQGGIPGALSNQPPGEVSVPEQVEGGDAAGQAAARQDSRSRAARNFELDKTISHTRFQQGSIRRLSVAVVINDLTEVNPETGEVTRIPWSQSDLDRFTLLVKDAVGFDVSRGDSVNVINSAFRAEPEEQLPEIPFYTEPWFWEVAKQVAGGLFLLILLFGFVRPMIKNIMNSGGGSRGDSVSAEDLDALDAASGGESGLGDDRVTLSGAGGILLPGPHEGYEQQLNAVKGLVAEDPGRVAQVIKQWVADDE